MIQDKDMLMNTNEVRVSIVIPTFNRKESLVRTLSSLFNQTFPKENFEIIVVDGSTDDTEKMIQEIIKSHSNLRYIRQVDKGAASARNLGIINSKGEIIGFTDDDCVVDQYWIEQAVESLRIAEFCGVQGKTLLETKVQKKNKIFNYVDVPTCTGDKKQNSYPTCNIFYRKKNLIEISCFDIRLKAAEDDDLAFRLIEKGYKIQFNKNIIVYHEVRYLNIIKFVFKRLKRKESIPLFYRKHPELRDRFFLKIFISTHVYIILTILTFFIYFLNLNVFVPLFFTLFAFLITRVFIDRNYKMMPVRILFFWRYFIIDFASVYYLVKGSIKHRSLLI
jgi:glycosyltransferase involved in cell wall biosynthesis